MQAAQLYLPSNVIDYLKDFAKSEHFQYIVEEQNFLDKHSAMWAFAKYPPTFNTADSVVIQSGHILLVKRKNAPGKDLWALPGGYLSGDTFEDAAIRELSEETFIKLQDIVLRRSIKEAKVFDHPDRSLRGRIITVAHLIHLEQVGECLPKVKGSDDASDARWFPISQFHGMEHVMFEDHFHIAMDMISRCN
jgi:bifunctional NMN adenylyltransferase/nudix hydrolase